LFYLGILGYILEFIETWGFKRVVFEEFLVSLEIGCCSFRLEWELIPSKWLEFVPIAAFSSALIIDFFIANLLIESGGLVESLS
jgi:hypothetical protein